MNILEIRKVQRKLKLYQLVKDQDYNNKFMNLSIKLIVQEEGLREFSQLRL